MKNQMLYILTGLPYSGKSTLARELAKKFNFEIVSVDEIMEEYNMWQKDQLSQSDWDLAYSEAYIRLKQKLKEGKTVIWDGGCLKFSERETLRQIARDLKVNYKLIYINTPIEKIKERRRKNKETNERGHLDDKMMKSALDMFEEPKSKENPLVYTSEIDLDKWIEENINSNLQN